MKGINRLPFLTNSFSYILKTIFLRKEIPFIGGIAINDKCNLHCKYCSVSNRNIPDLSYQEIKEGLQILYNMSIRYLYIEGGEPFLWKDHSKKLEDIIDLAKDIGFTFITVYTNGTFPIETKATSVFVSLDGVKTINDSLRGVSFDKVISNIQNSSHKRIIINCTLSKKNKYEIENFCKELGKIPNVKGVFFCFYTPVNGKDNLCLEFSEKQYLAREIIELKHQGYNILNSKVALKNVYNDCWKRPSGLSYLYAEKKLYKCCRMIGNDEVCEQCGYLGYTEISHIAKLNPEAVLTAFKYI